MAGSPTQMWQCFSSRDLGVSRQRDETCELPSVPCWELLHGRMGLGVSNPGRLISHSSFFSFIKGKCPAFPALTYSTTKQSRNMSSTASFVCTLCWWGAHAGLLWGPASESYHLLEPICAAVTHIDEPSQTGMPTSFPSFFAVQSRCVMRPLSARGSILHRQSRVEHVSSQLDGDERGG